MTRAAAVLLLAVLPSVTPASARHFKARAPQTAAAEQAFHGTWSAVGRRRTLPTETGVAAVVELSGAVVWTDPKGGFHAEAIGFDDGGGLGAGRAVWTDARGDRVFSALRGEPLQTGRRVTGTITGGTGRYAGAAGDYALTWQYVVPGEDGVIQGRTVDLAGRMRLR